MVMHDSGMERKGEERGGKTHGEFICHTDNERHYHTMYSESAMYAVTGGNTTERIEGGMERGWMVRKW